MYRAFEGKSISVLRVCWFIRTVLHQEMKSRGIPAGLIAHNAVMVACDRGGVWEDAMTVMREMRNEGITPDVIGYAAAIRYVNVKWKLRIV